MHSIIYGGPHSFFQSLKTVKKHKNELAFLASTFSHSNNVHTPTL